jgi:hypothetical protein
MMVRMNLTRYIVSIYGNATVSAGRMIQVVKHLPSKHEALSSNPTTAKKMLQ